MQALTIRAPVKPKWAWTKAGDRRLSTAMSSASKRGRNRRRRTRCPKPEPVGGSLLVRNIAGQGKASPGSARAQARPIGINWAPFNCCAMNVSVGCRSVSATCSTVRSGGVVTSDRKKIAERPRSLGQSHHREGRRTMGDGGSWRRRSLPWEGGVRHAYFGSRG